MAETCAGGGLAAIPFPLKGFHCDNGSEFINYRVAALLEKLLIEQTKSRPRHSHDNGLVESKNGAVVRKHRAIYPVKRNRPPRFRSFIANT